ncbi:MAG: hypothetical protein EAZ73_09265 [Oscillatoriales cyanobacterium]|uniref:hypothetical protein n=1 Tax=unclassified Microcoleus TaxID=2642155 RepID=UPI001DFBA555|nr:MULTISPECIES: hypothetical protein [unclassified Microcoleus]TAF00837.1 MAG: hypothetical protein EAZ79_01330 [Oscillatoriales cyanobacterium]MCC3459825.1 hypothetical protein [Microcoleus sp. PH2017_11_PCY_U_A]MCC3478258.1 hypothetical protein [Microcoleus sp. PH2017_12_PCY_D_A]TAF21404.1 MAG: hypothetical protein EAZ73_09265 [Oscillatoriales cyanobacterium]TAF39669.1 MAG: hypothetical protein EAZ69_00080 [Oscillatoriales cyanobacterium]
MLLRSPIASIADYIHVKRSKSQPANLNQIPLRSIATDNWKLIVFSGVIATTATFATIAVFLPVPFAVKTSEAKVTPKSSVKSNVTEKIGLLDLWTKKLKLNKFYWILAIAVTVWLLNKYEN